MSAVSSRQYGAMNPDKCQKEIVEIYQDHLMEEQSEISDEIALKRREEIYRACLKKDPDNHEARAALARCLFLQWTALSAFMS